MATPILPWQTLPSPVRYLMSRTWPQMVRSQTAAFDSPREWAAEWDQPPEVSMRTWTAPCANVQIGTVPGIHTKVRQEVTARCHAAITTPIGDSGRQLPLSYTARASVRTPLQRRGPQSTHSSILITVGVAARVSKGCHRKFQGHNFESCVTNFDKISGFSLRSRYPYGKFRGFHPSSEFVP